MDNRPLTALLSSIIGHFSVRSDFLHNQGAVFLPAALPKQPALPKPRPYPDTFSLPLYPYMELI
jgi:hypothetical protein